MRAPNIEIILSGSLALVVRNKEFSEIHVNNYKCIFTNMGVDLVKRDLQCMCDNASSLQHSTASD